MNCDELLQRLTEYADGVLDPALCAEIERHLTDCSNCAELQHDLADLSRLCRQCGSPRLPEEVRRRIEARLRG